MHLGLMSVVDAEIYTIAYRGPYDCMNGCY
jgi:hypothetical protein